MLNEMSNNRNFLNLLFNVLTFPYLACFNLLDMLSAHKYSADVTRLPFKVKLC